MVSIQDYFWNYLPHVIALSFALSTASGFFALTKVPISQFFQNRRIRPPLLLEQYKGRVLPDILHDVLGIIMGSPSAFIYFFCAEQMRIAGFELRTDPDSNFLRRAVELCVLLVLNETYFYFMHRFFLHSKYGWWMHSYHHHAVVLTPLTGFSFHILETILMSMPIPLLSIFFHYHTTTLQWFSLFVTLHTAYQHCGFELLPIDLWPFKYYHGAFFHDIHHEGGARCHYGLYTTYFDEVFGTVHRDVDKRAIALLTAHERNGKPLSEKDQ